MELQGIEKALSIEGWMKEEELLWLANQAAKHQNILEIGSWQGRSSYVLAANTPGKLLCVDTWKGTMSERAHRERLAGKGDEWLLAQFIRNVEQLPNISWLRLPSLEAATLLHSRNEPKFDMIFIDGDHEYEPVRNDILAWRPMLAEGGLFCGHDMSSAFTHTVVRALKDVLPGRHKAVGAGSIWMEIPK